MIQISFARAVSILLGGPLVFLLFILVIAGSGLTIRQFTIIFPVFLLLQMVIPLSFLLFSYRVKKVKDLDVTDKKERRIPLLVQNICFLCSVIVAFYLGTPLLFKLTLLLFILSTVNTVITFIWKISLHMTTGITFALLFNLLSGWKYPYLFFLIPLIFWSRLVLKKHTIAQLVVAFLLNAFIILVYMK